MTRKFNEKKLVIATKNKGKVKELNELLQGYNIELIPASEFTDNEPEENGNSFIANAEIKSRFYSKLSGLPALADDSGLSIDELGGAPGIYSARWAGPDKDFNIAMNKVKDELAQKNKQTSGARFVCALSLCFNDGHVENFEGTIEGNVSFPAKGENGFGYDPIFTPNNYDKTFAELDNSIKQKISHRADAFNKLIACCF